LALRHADTRYGTSGRLTLSGERHRSVQRHAHQSHSRRECSIPRRQPAGPELNKSVSPTAADIAAVLDNVFAGNLPGKESDTPGRTDLQDSPATRSVQRASRAVQEGGVDAFYHLFVHPIDSMIDAVLTKELPDSPQAQFLFRHSRFVENHFKNLIAQFEGSSCSVDKARTVMRRLLTFFQTGKRIAFDYTETYTYNLPKRVLCEHDEIVAYFDGLRSLFYGISAPYIVALHAVTMRMGETAEGKP